MCLLRQATLLGTDPNRHCEEVASDGQEQPKNSLKKSLKTQYSHYIRISVFKPLIITVYNKPFGESIHIVYLSLVGNIRTTVCSLGYIMTTCLKRIKDVIVFIMYFTLEPSVTAENGEK